MQQSLVILGASGSIGVSTLDVVARHPERFRVHALTANTRVETLAKQCVQFQPAYAVVRDAECAATLRSILQEAHCDTEVLFGVGALCSVAADPEVDTVMAAIVGAAGLAPTLAAVQAGKKILLANKEALVMAGQLFMAAVRESGAVLLPIDSEHNAIFQCLPTDYCDLQSSGVRKLLLSASGGPFREWSAEQIYNATPDQACAHPNWDMGRKISVDSATLMNKGLEVIEACHLFAVSPEQIQVVVHPQSLIHSLVQYVDGSVLAQLGNPDMRTPIAHALAWPERIESGVADLDLIDVAQIDFEEPDLRRFPCLELAYTAAAQGGSAPVVLNAANEIAVQAFLEDQIRFGQIGEVVGDALNGIPTSEPDTLEAVQEIDRTAREWSTSLITRLEA